MATSSGTRRRGRQLDEIAVALPQRAASLFRLLLARTSIPVSRTEASVLAALAQRPRRITQPAITLLVNRLEARGWAERHADAADRRAVQVTLTPSGREALEQLRREYRALVHEELATLPNEDLCTLARAIEILDSVIERLDKES